MTSFIVTRVSPDSYLNDPHHKYSAVSGDLPSRFTILEKPYWAGYVQMSKCIHLQIMALWHKCF